jgi:hypothetical protein
MRRTLTTAFIVSLSAALGCSNPTINHGNGGGAGGTGGGVGGTGGSAGSGGGGSGGSGGGGGSGGMSGGPDGGNNCGVQNFMLNKTGTPDLIIIQDRSESMTDPPSTSSPPGTASKWTQVVAGLEQVLPQVTSVNWGLMMFASDDDCGAPTMPNVAPAPMTAAAIKTQLDGTMPTSSTPTTATINNAVAYYSTLKDNNAHYLLLATDGMPNCGSGFGGGDDSANAEKAVTAAATAGIKTFVLGIGDDPTGDATLTQMAINGGVPDTSSGSPSYFPINSQADLVKAFQTAAGTIVSCDYQLQSAPTDPNLVTITDNKGNTIPHDTTHMNGWDFGPGDTSIQFYGAACMNLQSGVTTGLAAVFGCPPIQ